MTVHSSLQNYILTAALLAFLVMGSSCSRILTSTIVEPTLGNLRQQTDVQLVCDGAPSYLLMLDSMLVGSPDDTSMLRTASQAFSSYSAALKSCQVSDSRIQNATEKAKRYGTRLLRQKLKTDRLTDTDIVAERLKTMTTSDVPDLFWGTWGWLAWVQEQRGSPESIADLVPIEQIMSRLLELDDSYESGAIHLFFGVYFGAKPVMFGGKPDKAKEHFEKALQLSHRQFLLIHTTYAETVGRNSFDQDLHDSLLKEVLSFDMNSCPQNLLTNQIALKKAQRLMEENFFGE